MKRTESPQTRTGLVNLREPNFQKAETKTGAGIESKALLFWFGDDPVSSQCGESIVK